MENKTYTDGYLSIEISKTASNIVVNLTGKSTSRNPGIFLAPILQQVITESDYGTREIVLDFRELTYMNSSTITPIIKFLNKAKIGNERVSLLYLKTLKWQELSFSALSIFKTKDDRIMIKGI
ncbi:MAG: hypothetical protein OEZ36_05820 [Spirochaetota bacterium]|nr:hypothetical protein [Spirochaetota bacterium]